MFLDVKENTTVSHLKMMIQGITKRKPEDMKLLKIGSREVLEDKKTLAECGFDSQSCKAQDPQTIGLVYKMNGKIIDLILLVCVCVCACACKL